MIGASGFGNGDGVISAPIIDDEDLNDVDAGD
jgi:hypothetical protein